MLPLIVGAIVVFTLAAVGVAGYLIDRTGDTDSLPLRDQPADQRP